MGTTFRPYKPKPTQVSPCFELKFIIMSNMYVILTIYQFKGRWFKLRQVG